MFRVLFAVAIGFAATASASPLPIYVLAGQSNMSGWGQSNELTGALALPQADVLFHAQKAGFGYLRPFDDDFGPEIAFGRTIANHSDSPIAIVKHAKGSTSLAVDWNPESGPLYAELMQRVTNSRNYWTSLGYDPFVAGIVWMQGEEDARRAEMAPLYEANLRNFITTIRADLAAPDAIFSLGLIRADHFTYREPVRSAQQVVGHEAGKWLAETDDLPTYEGLHFTTAAQLLLGERLAAPFLPQPASGDADGDGDVDLEDLNLVRNHFGLPGVGDVDGSGLVDLGDLNAVRNNFGASQTVAVPEPSSLLLALLTFPALRSYASWKRSRLRR